MHLMPWHKHFEGIKQNLMSKLDREEENEGEFNGLWGEGNWMKRISDMKSKGMNFQETDSNEKLIKGIA